MADQSKNLILRLKLEVDSSGNAKLAEGFKPLEQSINKIAEKTNDIKKLEADKLSLLEEQKKAFTALEAVQIRQQSLADKNNKNAGLALYNLEKAIVKHNEINSIITTEINFKSALIIKEQAELDVLKQQKNVRADMLALMEKSVSSAKLPSMIRGDITSGMTRAGNIAEEENKLKRNQALLQNFNEATAKIEAEASARRQFHLTADTNATKIATAAQEKMYAAMFDSINARASSFGSKMASGTAGSSMIGGMTAAAKTSITTIDSTSITDNTEALNKNKVAADIAAKTHTNLFARVGEVIGAYQIWNAVLTYTKQALLAIPNAGIELESTKAALFGIFGSEQGAKNMEFLSELANNAGQSLLGLEQAYRRYAPSAILAGASQEEINKSFKDFAEVGTILHLPEEKINSLFLALDQIFAKGKVQSEEIKKQLGNVLPGAVEVGAKAMQMSPAAFMEAMSKNLINAKEFIPKFAKIYRETFGGIDDSVFESIRTKLLSNLQRVQNEYLRINREIYNSTHEMMNTIVKAAANALTLIRENLTGIGQALTIFSELIALRLGIALVSSIASIGTLITKIGLLVPILTGLSIPVTAVVAAFTTLYGIINDLGINYDKATGFTIQFKEQQVSLTNYIKAFSIIAIEDLTLAYQKFTSLFSDSSFSVGVGRVFDKLSTKVSFLKDGLFAVMAATAALAKKATGSTESISELYLAGLVDLNENLKKAPVIKLAAELDIKDKPKAEAVVPPTKLAKTVEDGGLDSKAASAAAKALRNLYKDLDRDLKLITEETKTSLAELEESYTKNLVSINTYYSKKASIQNAEVERQKAVYEKELTIAKKSGDIAKIEQISDKINVLSEQASRIPSILGKEQFKDLQNYNKSLAETNAAYQEMLGNAGEAARIRAESAGSPKIALFKAQGNEEAVQRQKLLEQSAQLTADLYGVDLKRKQTNEEYNRSIAKTNVLKMTGNISELQAAIQLTDANAKQIQQLEEELRIDREKMALAGTAVTPIMRSKYANDLAELENLKVTANAVGSYIQNVLGASFDSAFASVVDGTASAGEAFNNFANSVVSDIARIVAQEIRLQAIKGIMSLFGTAFSGFGSVNGGINSAGIPNLLARPSANGNVFSGAGISAHSNTVVSSPTIFPFARGVGLMGEAGPEAILPLQRNSQGKLGVAVNQTNDKSSGIVIQNFSVTVQEKEDSTSEDQAKLIGETVKKQLKVLIQQELITSTRSGGTLNPTSMAVSF